MLTHDNILNTFRQAFPAPDDVALVARYANPLLQLPRRRAHIFLPDCHLLSNDDLPFYPKNKFVQDADLLTLLEHLTVLKKDSPGMLQVWHLGDIFDIWRARGGLGPAAEVDKIAADHAPIIDLLRDGAPWGVGAHLIAGNHDYQIYWLPEWRDNTARYRLIQHSDPAGGDVLVLHGDIFEPLENLLPNELQAWAVRFTTWWGSAGRQDLFNEADVVAQVNRGLPAGDRPVGSTKVKLARRTLPDPDSGVAVNVIHADTGSAKNKKFFAGAKALAEAFHARGHNIRLVVLAHTHFARIVEGAFDDGSPFVLMDCGAWIGTCRLAPGEPWIYCAQVGVLAEDELRLYQLGRRVAG